MSVFIYMKEENAKYQGKFIKSHGLTGEAKSTFKSQSRHAFKQASKSKSLSIKSKALRA